MRPGRRPADSADVNVGGTATQASDDTSATRSIPEPAEDAKLKELYERGFAEHDLGESKLGSEAASHYRNAVELWEQAAKGLHLSSMVALASCLLQGKEGVEKDELRAQKLFILLYLLGGPEPSMFDSPLSGTYYQSLRRILLKPLFNDVRQSYEQLEALVAVYMGLLEIFKYFYERDADSAQNDQFVRRKNFAEAFIALTNPTDLQTSYHTIFQAHLVKTQRVCGNRLKLKYGSASLVFSMAKSLGWGTENYLRRLETFADVLKAIPSKHDVLIYLGARAFLFALIGHAKAETTRFRPATTFLYTEVGSDAKSTASGVSWAESCIGGLPLHLTKAPKGSRRGMAAIPEGPASPMLGSTS